MPKAPFEHAPRSREADEAPLDVAAPLDTPSDPDPLVEASRGPRRLQLDLERRPARPEPGAKRRWSARRTLAFVTLSSLALWGLIIWGAATLLDRLEG